MSAVYSECMRIMVTNGDALPNNRTSGSSNTGTYFVSSTGDFSRFEVFFNSNMKYVIPCKAIEVYKVLFVHFFKNMSEYFPDHMESFESYCDELSMNDHEISGLVDYRINDSRIFMKFSNNSDPVISLFRKILYAKLSSISFEIVKGVCYIYPVINYEEIKNKEKAFLEYFIQEVEDYD